MSWKAKALLHEDFSVFCETTAGLGMEGTAENRDDPLSQGTPERWSKCFAGVMGQKEKCRPSGHVHRGARQPRAAADLTLRWRSEGCVGVSQVEGSGAGGRTGLARCGVHVTAGSAGAGS